MTASSARSEWVEQWRTSRVSSLSSDRRLGWKRPSSRVMALEIMLVPSTTTDPLDADTDDGGVPDGLEDLDLNDRVNTKKRDPLVRADDIDRHE